MTGGDLIVLAPWLFFGACLAAIWARLIARSHASRRRSGNAQHKPADEERSDV